eukprot:Rmarinus@m.18607
MTCQMKETGKLTPTRTRTARVTTKSMKAMKEAKVMERERLMMMTTTMMTMTMMMTMMMMMMMTVKETIARQGPWDGKKIRAEENARQSLECRSVVYRRAMLLWASPMIRMRCQTDPCQMPMTVMTCRTIQIPGRTARIMTKTPKSDKSARRRLRRRE